MFERVVQGNIEEGLVKGEGFEVNGGLIQTVVIRQWAVSQTESRIANLRDDK